MTEKGIRNAKILRPTEKQFMNFRKYIEKVYSDPAMVDEGCVKVF